MVVPKIKFAVGLFVILVQLFLYVNADYIYGVYADMVRTVLVTYFFLLALFSPIVIQILSGIGLQDIPNFSIGFILTAVVMLVVPAMFLVTGQLETGLSMALGFGFLHSMVKAFNEEIVFRGVLPKIMGGSIYADIISSVTFGVFHFAVTGVNWMAMFLLMGLGFVWVLVRNRFGLMGSTGSHFAYNLGVLGVLPQLIGV